MKMATVAILTSIAVIMLVVQMVQIDNLKEKISGLVVGSAVSTGTGPLDTTGWTENEIMNYEMHGTIPARARVSMGSNSAGASTAGAGMVGGC